MNVRSDSILARLTQSQLADLYDWILASDGYAAVQTRAAKPVEEGGLGLNIHITTLTRFYASYTAWLRAQEIADGERDPDSSPDRLHTTAACDLAHAIHDLARGPLKPADLKLIAKYLQQQRDHTLKTEYLKVAQHHAEIATQKQKLAENRHAEQIRQFEFCAAREVMKAYVAYAEIDQRTDIDEIDKIWEARKVAYGPRADETPKPKRANSGLGSPGSRPAPDQPLSPPCSPKPRANEDPSSIASAKEEALSPLRAAADSEQRLPASVGPGAFDTLIAANFETPIAAAPNPQLPDSEFSPQSSILSPEKKTQVHIAPENQPLRTQDPGLRSASAPSPHPSSLIRPGVKTPAAWLEGSKDPTAMVRFFLHDVCNGSSDRFEDFMKSSRSFAIQPDLLKKLGETP